MGELKILPTGRIVIVTGMTVQFPTNAGWTKEILNRYVKRGGFLKHGIDKDPCNPSYFIPEFGSNIDYDKMVSDSQVARVLDKHLYQDTYNLSTLDILKLRG